MIFLFKYPTGEKPSDTPKDGSFDFEALEKGYSGEGGVWFASQVIQNACGTQALLGMLMNKAERTAGGVDGQRVVLGNTLEEFKEFTMAFPADVSGLSGCTAGNDADIDTAERRGSFEFRSDTRYAQLFRSLEPFCLG